MKFPLRARIFDSVSRDQEIRASVAPSLQNLVFRAVITDGVSGTQASCKTGVFGTADWAFAVSRFLQICSIGRELMFFLTRHIFLTGSVPKSLHPTFVLEAIGRTKGEDDRIFPWPAATSRSKVPMAKHTSSLRKRAAPSTPFPRPSKRGANFGGSRQAKMHSSAVVIEAGLSPFVPSWRKR
jgi:hypothetical protein